MSFLKSRCLSDFYESEAEPDLIPLINIIFLLLIFFIITGQQNSEKQVELLPYSAFSRQIESKKVDLVIEKNGQIFFQGKQVAESDFQQQLQRWKMQFSEAPELRIAVASELEASVLTRFFSKIRGAGIRNIELASTPSARKYVDE